MKRITATKTQETAVTTVRWNLDSAALFFLLGKTVRLAASFSTLFLFSVDSLVSFLII
ncbi:MAG TPA: hypothetical protein PK854_09345 [Oscillospiraceae bacterium]|nr:hypothetical protein [Oscillospiraceae bacterium]HPS35458.1 hypothetical protein [Oscillospiraceae bacterium]